MRLSDDQFREFQPGDEENILGTPEYEHKTERAMDWLTHLRWLQSPEGGGHHFDAAIAIANAEADKRERFKGN